MIGVLGLVSATLSCVPKDKALQPASAPTEDDYLIGPGDILEISVWKEEALTRQTVVRPDGFISFPLIGDVLVAGKSTDQLKAEMGKKLGSYVLDASVTVDVKQINSMIIFVTGKVNSPGRFNVNSNIDVLQALVTAGGLNVFAKRSDIKVFRKENGKTKIFFFDYDDVVEGKRLEQNIRLQRGDIVIVP
jgi:polysaccharide export outer membrane protein